MRAHGEYEIHVKDPVVYGIPLTSFNPEGVDQYFAEIIQSAAPLKQWVLFENPQTEAALTMEAVNRVLTQYQSLSKHGCVGIALQLSNVIARVLQHQETISEMDIPFIASRNQIELSHFVGSIAESIEANVTNVSSVG
jgi:hypothetical protein